MKPTPSPLVRVLWIFLLSLAPIFSAQAILTVGDLRCENRHAPLGIDATQPRLSCRLNAGGRNVKQTAYQILVACTEARLKSDRGDVWDSGKVESDQSIQLPYAGRPLASYGEC